MEESELSVVLRKVDEIKEALQCAILAKERALWQLNYYVPFQRANEIRLIRNEALEEAARAAETAKIPGSLLRPGIAKIIRELKEGDV